MYSVAGRKMSRSSKYVRRRRAKMGPCPCGGGERRGASVGSGRPAGRPRASRGQGTVPRIIELLFVVLGWWAGRVGGQWCSTQRAAVQPLSGPPTSLPQAAHTEVRPAGCGSRGGTVLRNAQQGAASTACRPPPSCCCYPSRRPAGLALTCPLPSGRHPSHPPPASPLPGHLHALIQLVNHADQLVRRVHKARRVRARALLCRAGGHAGQEVTRRSLRAIITTVRATDRPVLCRRMTAVPSCLLCPAPPGPPVSPMEARK